MTVILPALESQGQGYPTSLTRAGLSAAAAVAAEVSVVENQTGSGLHLGMEKHYESIFFLHRLKFT